MQSNTVTGDVGNANGLPGAGSERACEASPGTLRDWHDGLGPDPDLTVSAWADQHRVLSPCGANEADHGGHLRAIMDALSPGHPCQRVIFMKGAQLGGTEAGN